MTSTSLQLKVENFEVSVSGIRDLLELAPKDDTVIVTVGNRRKYDELIRGLEKDYEVMAEMGTDIAPRALYRPHTLHIRRKQNA